MSQPTLPSGSGVPNIPGTGGGDDDVQEPGRALDARSLASSAAKASGNSYAKLAAGVSDFSKRAESEGVVGAGTGMALDATQAAATTAVSGLVSAAATPVVGAAVGAVADKAMTALRSTKNKKAITWLAVLGIGPVLIAPVVAVIAGIMAIVMFGGVLSSVTTSVFGGPSAQPTDTCSSSYVSVNAGSTGASSAPSGASFNASGLLIPQYIFYELVSYGFTKEQAGGVLGNIMQESGGNPVVANASSGAWGLFQWLGGRLTGAQSYITSQLGAGYTITSPSLPDWPDDKVKQLVDAELTYMIGELEDPAVALDAGPAVLNSTSVQEAATAFSVKFERAGAAESMNDRRVTMGTNAVSAWGNDAPAQGSNSAMKPRIDALRGGQTVGTVNAGAAPANGTPAVDPCAAVTVATTPVEATGSVNLDELYTDSTAIACPAPTKDAGIQTAYYGGAPFQIRLCAIPNATSIPGYDTGGTAFGGGHPVVNARVAGLFYQLFVDWTSDPRTTYVGPPRSSSSFRTAAMQVAVQGGANSAAAPNHSLHQSGLAMDIQFPGGNLGSQCTFIGGMCAPGSAQDRNNLYAFLTQDGAKYGIHQYTQEYWHWQLGTAG